MRYALSILALQLALSLTSRSMEPPPPPEKNDLAKHLERFAQGKTRKTIQQFEIAYEEDAPLAAHLKHFSRKTTRTRHHAQLEVAPPLKTELERNQELIFLKQALAQNNLPTLKELLELGHSPNLLFSQTLRQTLLHQAALLGHDKQVAFLLEQPTIQIDPHDISQATPLSHAVTRQRPKCIGHLLEHGACVTLPSNQGNFLHEAVFHNKIYSVIAFLIFCINPRSPLPPATTELEEDDTMLTAEQEEDQERLREILDTFFSILKAPELQSSNVHSLQKLCATTLLHDHFNALKTKDCALLGTLWKKQLRYILPDTITELLAKSLTFAQARAFIMSFPEQKDRNRIAPIFAQHFAQLHINNIAALFTMASHTGQTPWALACAQERSTCFRLLLNPASYCSVLYHIIRPIEHISPFLTQHPAEQDPLSLFYHIFLFRLQGGEFMFSLPQ